MSSVLDTIGDTIETIGFVGLYVSWAITDTVEDMFRPRPPPRPQTLEQQLDRLLVAPTSSGQQAMRTLENQRKQKSTKRHVIDYSELTHEQASQPEFREGDDGKWTRIDDRSLVDDDAGTMPMGVLHSTKHAQRVAELIVVRDGKF